MKTYLIKSSVEQVLARKNMSKKEFSNRVGITNVHLCRLFSRKSCPSPELRVRICSATARRWDDLFSLGTATSAESGGE